MNYGIVYFSGTGNTHFVANKIKDILDNYSVESELIPYEKISADLNNYNNLFIGFPVYGLVAPEFFINKIIQYYDFKDKNIYLFGTMAYSSGISFYKLSMQIKKLGGNIIGSRVVSMPGSDGIGMLSKESNIVKKMIDRDFNLIPEIKNIKEDIIKILNGVKIPLNESLKLNIFNKTFFEILAFLMLPFENVLKRKLYADNTCSGCGYCQKICPVNNITVSNKSVIFGNSCVICMRCIHHCPLESINLGKLTKNKYKYHGPGIIKFKPLTFFKDYQKD
ncbi:MAG: EFR1 family ferrodoxin [Spirochaetales bacterium]|nr:EFR1 family ferrodoxin [Spirochaetales bacterium]